MSHTPTRVLVVIPNLGLGGAERFTVRLIRVLSRDDNPFQIEWHVAALDLSGELVSQLPRGVGRMTSARGAVARFARSGTLSQ
jgi:hypothetical protein